MGKVCAIFGGSRGVGKGVAVLLAQKGCHLAIIAGNLEVAQTTARNLGGGHLTLSCDVSSKQGFEEMQRKLGLVDYLVNAAGINRDGLLLRTKTEDIAQIHTNLLGTMLTCKSAVKNMIQHPGGGAIVNTGSIVGLKGNSGKSVYSANKAGLVGLSRFLAKKVAKKQI